MDDSIKCPKCGTDADPGWKNDKGEEHMGGFIEVGEWEDDKCYEVEADLSLFHCPKCGCHFGVV